MHFLSDNNLEKSFTEGNKEVRESSPVPNLNSMSKFMRRGTIPVDLSGPISRNAQVTAFHTENEDIAKKQRFFIGSKRKVNLNPVKIKKKTKPELPKKPLFTKIRLKDDVQYM